MLFSVFWVGPGCRYNHHALDRNVCSSAALGPVQEDKSSVPLIMWFSWNYYLPLATYYLLPANYDLLFAAYYLPLTTYYLRLPFYYLLNTPLLISSIGSLRLDAAAHRRASALQREPHMPSLVCQELYYDMILYNHMIYHIV